MRCVLWIAVDLLARDRRPRRVAFSVARSAATRAAAADQAGDMDERTNVRKTAEPL